MTQGEMACQLRVDPSTISREFSVSGGRHRYDARKAQARATKKRTRGKRASKKLLSHASLYTYVEEKLLLFWSPEQIAGRGKEEMIEMVSHETIYQFIYDEQPEWKVYLRQKKGKYRRRWGTKRREKEREEGKKKRIDTRPVAVGTRERIGDWEGDTIVGGEKITGILTHLERKSGFLLADLFLKKSAEEIQQKTVKRFALIAPDKKYTITYDNGTEFSDHERLGRFSGISIYFAWPYHSWERGANENVNGLLRQFFPKKMMFATLKQKDVDRIVDLINHRPRKRLNYLTPHEVFVEGKLVALQARM
jgi:IS30 family transposase